MADEAEAIMRQDGGFGPTEMLHELVFMQARLRLVDGDLDAAERYVVEAIDIGAICESRPILGEALVLGAALVELRGRDDDARRLVELSVELTTQPGNPQWHPLLPPNTRAELAGAATDALHPVLTERPVRGHRDRSSRPSPTNGPGRTLTRRGSRPSARVERFHRTSTSGISVSAPHHAADRRAGHLEAPVHPSSRWPIVRAP